MISLPPQSTWVFVILLAVGIGGSSVLVHSGPRFSVARASLGADQNETGWFRLEPESESDDDSSIELSRAPASLTGSSSDPRALKHDCDQGVIAACQTFSELARRLINQAEMPEEEYYQWIDRAKAVRELNLTLEAELRGCRGGLADLCESALSHLAMLEGIAPDPNPNIARSIEKRVDTDLDRLCKKGNFDACEIAGFRTVKRGEKTGREDTIAAGVDLLLKACLNGRTLTCSHAARSRTPRNDFQAIIEGVRNACESKDFDACIDLKTLTSDEENHDLADWKLWELCQLDSHSAFGFDMTSEHRACVSLGFETQE